MSETALTPTDADTISYGCPECGGGASGYGCDCDDQYCDECGADGYAYACNCEG